MTTGKAVRLILMKDVRRYIWPLVMLFGIGLLITLTLYLRGTTSTFYMVPTAVFVYLIGLFLIMDLIQIDWPGRDLRFLFTRPVRGEAIFFAKLLFLGLLLILGGWGFRKLTTPCWACRFDPSTISVS